MSERFIPEKQHHVMWLRFNRPGRLNATALAQTAMTRDNLEGARAFFEKREPRFTGE